MQRKLLLALAAVGVLLGGIVAGVAVLLTDDDARVTASSSAGGSDPRDLLEEPGGPGWSSDGETVGAWVRTTWATATELDTVRVDGGGERSWSEAVIQFGDGSSLLVAADGAGNAAVSFPARSVTEARLVFSAVPDGRAAVTLAGLRFDGTGASVTAAGVDDVVTASASSGTDAAVLVDGAGGDLGEEWTAASGDDAPWVAASFAAPREVASVQIFGPSGSWFDPAYAAAAPLNGRLVFDDGSTVRVSGIAGGDGGPTTVSFAPRVTETVRLELERTIDDAEPGLREFEVFGTGTTPPRWTGTAQLPAVTPEQASCPSDETPARAGAGAVTLLCPTPGAAVDGETTIVVAATPAASLEAIAWVPDTAGGATGAEVVVGAGEADDDGRAEIVVDADRLMSGPVAVRVEAAGALPGDVSQSLTVQLVNLGGVAARSAGVDTTGMTLQWDDEFDSPLSASTDGSEAEYAATKPAYWGTSEFGDAVFDSPTSGRATFTTVADDYLRIRVQPLGGRTDPAGWDREHTGGILSSLRVGGSGFAAQYGYFEARMLGAPGTGTWPAFWMMNSDSATRTEVTSEVDAVELYGNDRRQTCHGTHTWQGQEDIADLVECIDPGGVEDWAVGWHTYGVRITPGGADFYVDGRLVTSHSEVSLTHEPFFFMVNLALGGGWPIDLEQTGDVTDLYVDYIRVYT